MYLEKRDEHHSYNNPSISNILVDLVKMLNAPEIDPEKVKELKALAANINNTDLKKAFLVDKLLGNNYVAKIVAIEVFAPGLVTDPEIREMMLNHLQDHGQDSIRKALVSALVPFVNKYAEIENTIIEVLSNQYTAPTVKQHIIKVLASRLFRQETRNLVIARLDDDSVPVRVAAVEVLSHYSDNIEIYEKVLTKLNDVDNAVRVAAIKALSGKILRDDFRKLLVAKLKSPDEHQTVKEAAIEALGTHLSESEDIQEEFIDVFFNSMSLSVRNAVREALMVNLSLEKLQDMFANALVYEQSKIKIKNSTKNKLDKLGSEEGDDPYGVVVSFRK